MRAIIVSFVILAAGAIFAFAFSAMTMSAGAGQSDVFGDVDCDGSVSAVDALKTLRYTASLTVTQSEPCPDIGSTPAPTLTPSPTSAGEPTPTPSPTLAPTPTPSQAPLEFTHLMARMGRESDCFPNSTGFCGFGDAPVSSTSVDVNAQLTALSAQGWRLVEVSTPSYGPYDVVVYTLSRPVP